MTLNRRTFLRNAALGAAAIAVPASASIATAEEMSAMKPMREELPTPYNSSNFSVALDSATVVGTTLENLKSAVAGETGATTKYSAFAEYAEKAGYKRLARLFRATADAEKIHIELEAALVEAEDPSWDRPVAEAPSEIPVDLSLISGANGEIYETSDMYPAFIKAAMEEGREDAVAVFNRAKLAEGYHAELYLDAYNTIDDPAQEDVEYYLCPLCGYIHKGGEFESCPICAAPAESFTAY